MRKFLLSRIPVMIWNPQFINGMCLRPQWTQAWEGLNEPFRTPHSPRMVQQIPVRLVCPPTGCQQDRLQAMHVMNENFVGQHTFIPSTDIECLLRLLCARHGARSWGDTEQNRAPLTLTELSVNGGHIFNNKCIQLIYNYKLVSPMEKGAGCYERNTRRTVWMWRHKGGLSMKAELKLAP